MSTTIGQYGASGTLYVLEQAISNLNTQETNLSGEASTGVTSTSYAGLGDNRSAALSLEPQITAVSAWQNSITAAQGTLSTTQTALTQISSMVTTLQTNLLSLSGSLGQSELKSIVSTATSDLATLGTLLNTSSGSGYVFAGTDANDPPVTDPSGLSTSSLAQATSSVVSTLSSSSAASVLEQATALATGTGSNAGYSVFSSALSVDGTSASSLQSSAVIGLNDTVSVGMIATQGSDATATSTGSPIRDLIRNLMVVASLGSADTSSTQFSDLVSSLQTSTSSISTSLTNEEGTLGISQNSLSSQSTMLSTMSTMLNTQLDNAKSADLASVSVQTTAIQNQLEASYSLVASLKSMTLASYI